MTTPHPTDLSGSIILPLHFTFIPHSAAPTTFKGSSVTHAPVLRYVYKYTQM